MLKQDELSNPNSCFSKAADDEPLFVLRAQDSFAAPLIEHWIGWAQESGVNGAKIAEAKALVELMYAWPKRRKPD